MDFLKASDSLIRRSTSIDLGDGERIHLQYCKEWKFDAYYYRIVRSFEGKIDQKRARIPSNKHIALLWAQADLEGWANLNGEEI